MKTLAFSLLPGETLEFWARGTAIGCDVFRLYSGQRTVFTVSHPSSHLQFYQYKNREHQPLSIDWNNCFEIVYAYSWHPDLLPHEGINFWDFSEAEQPKQLKGKALQQWMRQDTERPEYHFSAPQAWINDPNGLCYHQGIYHLFYQFHPLGTDWGPMHWGHAVSKDLFHWLQYPVFLHPEQNLWGLGATGGAFSGSAFHDRDGALSIYYTERLPAYHTEKNYHEIQKRCIPDNQLIKPRYTETILEQSPAGVRHDFRDPKVWFDESKNAYRMVLGSNFNGQPAVLLYGSEDAIQWHYLSPLFVAPKHYAKQGARSIECPDFFELDGYCVLIMGFVGFIEPETGRHNTLYALVGDFNNDQFVPHGDLQLLDFGTDFYAMQSFDDGKQRLAFGWVFNWKNRKPSGSRYSGEVSLPRVLTVKDHHLCMLPYQYEPTGNWKIQPEVEHLQGKQRQCFMLYIKGRLSHLTIKGQSENGIGFSIKIDQQIRIALNEDTGDIQYVHDWGDSISELLVCFDHGVIELFADGGRLCATRRSYQALSIDVLSFSGTGYAVTVGYPTNYVDG